MNINGLTAILPFFSFSFSSFLCSLVESSRSRDHRWSMLGSRTYNDVWCRVAVHKLQCFGQIQTPKLMSRGCPRLIS